MIRSLFKKGLYQRIPRKKYDIINEYWHSKLPCPVSEIIGTDRSRITGVNGKEYIICKDGELRLQSTPKKECNKY